MNIALSSFARSGSHLLSQHLEQALGISSVITHVQVMDSDSFVVSMIRNPHDTIVSFSSMRMHHGVSQPEIEMLLSRYIIFYEYIINRSDLIIDYDFMLNDPFKVVTHFSNLLNIPVINDKVINDSVDNPSGGYMVTSKASPYYQAVKDYMKYFDLTKANSLYEVAKSKTDFS